MAASAARGRAGKPWSKPLFTPFCVNLTSSSAMDAAMRRARLASCARYRVPLVLTNLGDPREEVIAAHDWGGLVFHDVTTLRFAEKAIAAGVDGLMLVCAGAAGHGGTCNPFAFLPRVRRLFDGFIILAGGIADGRGVAAALALGADLAVMGTCFIATQESGVAHGHKAMLVRAGAEDVLFTDTIVGLPANFLTPSMREAGWTRSSCRRRSPAIARTCRPVSSPGRRCGAAAIWWR